MAKTQRKFSKPQQVYMLAKAAFDTAYTAHREHDKLMDVECVRLGILKEGESYGILPDGHPMWTEGQRLLDRENEFRALMYQAACCLFDWATETTLAKLGTDQQKADVRAMVISVKEMAWVEKPFEELVDISMRLAA